MLAEYLRYGNGLERPKDGVPFFGDYGIDLSIRIVWAGHDRQSTTVAESVRWKVSRGAKVSSQGI